MESRQQHEDPAVARWLRPPGEPPTLTSGLPVFNGAKYLEQAADSILSQSFDDFELIISDNATTDETETIGRALAARDRRVSYRRNADNVGLSGNFNGLVDLARGRLFKWAAADDVRRPRHLDRCIEAMRSGDEEAPGTDPRRLVLRMGTWASFDGPRRCE